ncbi:MAG TPA: dihydroneopterin aldolase [Blastocatellia bacterium]|nr:dihydroneopterin aldolase [Blastocatellia bacterium]
MEKASDRIVLSGLEFYGRHGVHAEENKLGARFVIDLEMYLSLDGISDRIKDTVDYGAVYEIVTREVTVSRFYLIEALANRIAEEVLEKQPKIARVIVRVHKPHAPIQGVFRDVFAEVTRSR